MFDKYKAAGLGIFLSSSALFGTLYYLLSYSQPTVLPESEIKEEEDLVTEPSEESNLDKEQLQEVVPRSDSMSALSFSQPIKETSSDTGLFAGIKENSIMYEFRSYLIGNKDSNKPWEPKLKIWKEKIGKQENTNPFTWKENNQPNFKNIKDRCEAAYKRESWNIDSGLKRGTTIKQYWDLVWTMCAKEETTAPENWGGVGERTT